ncbi:hypothetical protein EhV171 [Emiliania huxleyi virus 86]|uniref:Putative membrane protein n=1 Tax=Emiliania huxleyi virus 86 (isolate United Kingdom/English Channel/1999) TaxID=654925 RepID=Q4A2W3_EHV8U|nr:hypothetical protein EhV171 [Emiliania huxleyi virus 86]AHA54760.1 putative membrane protein [Emiliania huxleyi virus 145]CAI65593.1 putative membrane protein [Emiliania huxleyi virus 86]
MASPVVQQNVQNLQAMQDAVPNNNTDAQPVEDGYIESMLASHLEEAKEELYILVQNMGAALIEFSKSVDNIQKRTKNKELMKTSAGCVKALKCIKDALKKSLYTNSKFLKSVKEHKNDAWTDDYIGHHKQLYEKVSDCMKQNLDYRTRNSQALFDFRAICLGMTINGQAIITDEDAQIFENVLNALNDIQTKQMDTADELLQIMSRAPASTRFAETIYTAYWNHFWTLLATTAGIAVLFGLQTLEPHLLTQNRLVGRYFSNADNSKFWVYNASKKIFEVVYVEPNVGELIRCPKGVGFSFFNGLSGNGLSLNYTCTAGNLIARMPLNTISTYIWHALSTPVNNILSHMLEVPITPEMTVVGIAAAAAVTGITFKTAYYLTRKRNRDDVPDVDNELTEVVIEGSEVSKELDKPASQRSKRPRTTRI